MTVAGTAFRVVFKGERVCDVHLRGLVADGVVVPTGPEDPESCPSVTLENCPYGIGLVCGLDVVVDESAGVLVGGVLVATPAGEYTYRVTDRAAFLDVLKRTPRRATA